MPHARPIIEDVQRHLRFRSKSDYSKEPDQWIALRKEDEHMDTYIQLVLTGKRTYEIRRVSMRDGQILSTKEHVLPATVKKPMMHILDSTREFIALKN